MNKSEYSKGRIQLRKNELSDRGTMELIIVEHESEHTGIPAFDRQLLPSKEPWAPRMPGPLSIFSSSFHGKSHESSPSFCRQGASYRSRASLIFVFVYHVYYLGFEIVRLVRLVIVRLVRLLRLAPIDNRGLNRWLDRVIFHDRSQSDFWKHPNRHTRHNWRTGNNRPSWVWLNCDVANTLAELIKRCFNVYVSISILLQVPARWITTLNAGLRPRSVACRI